MAPPMKRQRTNKPHTPNSPVIQPREWLYGKRQPGANTKSANIARPHAQPVGNKAMKNEHNAMAIKSVKLTQVVDENTKFRKRIQELETKLAATAPLLAPAPAPPTTPPPMAPPAALTQREQELKAALTKMEIDLEKAKYDLRAQNYFDNRARHYAYYAALSRALKTRAMHEGSRYLALRPTLPYRDLPEGPVIYAIPRTIVTKPPAMKKQ